MFEFAHIEYLWWLLIIPLLILIFIITRYKRVNLLKRFGDPAVLKELMPDVSLRRPVWKFLLFVFALGMIILALAGPRFGSRLEEVRREGVEIIIALDVSNSMLAEDIEPNRLDRSRMAISRLMGELRNDRLGLIVFAGDAFVQIPVTADYSAARMILGNITTEAVPVQGTAIGRAIELAARSFTDNDDNSKVLIIISDGEDHEDNPVAVAKTTGEQGMVIHTIGIGRPEGTPVPYPGNGPTRFLTDSEGNTVLTRLDETTLRNIASAGGGTYVRATSSRVGLDLILDEIEEMEKIAFEEMVYTEFEERFQYMAGIALLLLILDFFILDKKNRWLNSVRVFE